MANQSTDERNVAYARIHHAGSSWIDTAENASRFIAQCLRDRDGDYEVTPVSMTREQFEALPEFRGF